MTAKEKKDWFMIAGHWPWSSYMVGGIDQPETVPETHAYRWSRLKGMLENKLCNALLMEYNWILKANEDPEEILEHVVRDLGLGVLIETSLKFQEKVLKLKREVGGRKVWIFSSPVGENYLTPQFFEATGRRNLWPEGFRSKEEAFLWYKNLCLNLNWGHKAGKDVFDLEKDNIMGWSAAIFNIHYLYEWGYRMCAMEFGYFSYCIHPIIAFSRGAAVQYGGDWYMYENSCDRWALEDGNFYRYYTLYNSRMEQMSGPSPGRALRAWMLGFMSGARIVLQELSVQTHWAEVEKDKATLTPIGELAKEFAEYTLHRHPERGAPHVPAVLIIEHDHGWDPPNMPILKKIKKGKQPTSSIVPGMDPGPEVEARRMQGLYGDACPTRTETT